MTGEVTFSRRTDAWTGSVRLHIDRADPHAHISADFLDHAVIGEVPYLTISGERLDVVTVTDDFGQRFVYRLGSYDPLRDAFEIHRLEEVQG